MKTMNTDTWTRRGINFLWDEAAFSHLAPPQEVLSFRAAVQLSKEWPEELPSNQGKCLIVAGLDVCIDLLTPEDAETWLQESLRPLIHAFQNEYEGEGSLVFWLPETRRRISMNSASEQYLWHCAPPNKDRQLEIGRLLWSGAESDAARIMDPDCTNQDADGPAWIGLHHPRVS